MKILMLLESEFPPDVRVENEIAALSEAGHEVHLACTTRKNRPPEERYGRMIIYRKAISTFIYKSSVGCLKLPFYFNFWKEYIFNLISKEKFDAIHVHDLPLSKIGAEAKRKFNVPMIIDLHENWPALLRHAPHTHTFAGRLLSSDRQWIDYEKRMLVEADLIITIIEEARDRVVSLGIEPGKIFIVSNTISLEGLSISGKKRIDDDFVLFYGGGINRHRGLQVVLDAIKILAKKSINLKLQVVGSGSYLKELEKQAARLEIESHVQFYGYKPFKEMLEMLAEADAAIIPHLRTENNDASSPNKLYQYMYLEKPVISSDCLSLKRMLTGTDAGFIYPDDSPDDLASLLENLFNNRQLLQEKGKNGRRAVISDLNWSRDSERLKNAYRTLENILA
jgi:glycosyltransferase involved in cell wall biosynthesis